MGFFKKLFGIESLPPPEVVSITDANFKKEVLQSDVPVLVDVWSDGCVPCAQLAPIVMKLSQKFHGRLKVVEVNAGRAPRTAGQLRVRGTPTVIYYHKGKEKERIVGFRGSLYHTDYIENELLPAVERQPAA